MRPDPDARYAAAILAAETAEDGTVGKARTVAARLTLMADEVEAGGITAARLARVRAYVDRVHNASKHHRENLVTATEDLVRSAVSGGKTTPITERLAEMLTERLRKLYPRELRRLRAVDLLVAMQALSRPRQRGAALQELCRKVGLPDKDPKDLAKTIERAKRRRRGTR